MVARFLAFCFGAAAIACAAQEVGAPGPGLLRGSAAISPGFMLREKAHNFYLTGKLEYFVDPRISFRGESFWFRGDQNEPALLAQNSQVAFGAFYHFAKGRSDLAIGFEPGVSIVQPARPVILIISEPLRVVPNVSLCAGYTFAVWEYFHFFLDARYVHASYPGAIGGPLPLDEVIIGGGLGFQFRTRRSN
ncbi:MAG: hypothetical protein IPL52_02125 [Flavobacteriales bacterium]|nr:hypothetical protein [Flavobacteriales bacterium]